MDTIPHALCDKLLSHGTNVCIMNFFSVIPLFISIWIHCVQLEQGNGCVWVQIPNDCTYLDLLLNMTDWRALKWSTMSLYLYMFHSTWKREYSIQALLTMSSMNLYYINDEIETQSDSTVLHISHANYWTNIKKGSRMTSMAYGFHVNSESKKIISIPWKWFYLILNLKRTIIIILR